MGMSILYILNIEHVRAPQSTVYIYIQLAICYNYYAATLKVEIRITAHSNTVVSVHVSSVT